MRRPLTTLILMTAAALMLHPATADAKASNSTSSGSKGSRTTQSAPGATQPIQRSLTAPDPSAPSTPSTVQTPKAAPIPPVTGGQPLGAPTATSTPAGVNPTPAPVTTPTTTSTTAAPPRPAIAAPAGPAVPQAQPSFFQRHPMLTGLAAGFLGASVASALFGGTAAAAADIPAEAGLIGGAFKWILIAGLAYLAFVLVRRLLTGGRQPAVAYGGAAAPRNIDMVPRLNQPAAAAGAGIGINTPVQSTDYDAWTRILTGIQSAWSRGDLAALQRLATPEMLHWFEQDLAENRRRGFQNQVEDVELLKGDVVESWQEGANEYVSARITFRARDYDVALAGNGPTGTVVAGDPHRAVETTEIWTFLRTGGSDWVLTAIEQA